MNGSKAFAATAIAAVAIMAAGCVTAPTARDYTSYRAANPRSILVVPALNNTVSVEAPDFFLSTISRPFGERGYYMFPAYMVKRVLEEDGLSDAGLVHNADASRFGALFGCDAVLFVEIEKWESQYIVLATSTNVEFNYTMKSCRDGSVLWTNTQALSYSPNASNSGNPLADLIATAIVAALEKAAPNYIPLTQQANLLASTTPGQGVPAGPYLPAQYQQDGTMFPGN